MKKAVILTVVVLACTLAVPQTGAGKGSSGAQSQASQITNGPVAEYVADSSAVLGWSAEDASANMSVKYGTDRDHMDETAQATAGHDGRNYHARIQGLSPETRYYFQVVQNNAPVGGIGTFRTVASGAAPIKSKATIPQ